MIISITIPGTITVAVAVAAVTLAAAEYVYIDMYKLYIKVKLRTVTLQLALAMSSNLSKIAAGSASHSNLPHSEEQQPEKDRCGQSVFTSSTVWRGRCPQRYLSPS